MRRGIYLFFSILLLIHTSCFTAQRNEKITAFRFALIGNTLPDSPFSGNVQKLTLLKEALADENPGLIIHTGNLIFGGTDVMGIKEWDIRRQYEYFFSCFKDTGIPLYTMPGESDFYNDSGYLYTFYTGRELNYSFNYGNIHIISLNYNLSTHYSKELAGWLKKDLEWHKDFHAIMIFSRALFLKEPGDGGAGNGEDTHSILKGYNVKWVISGAGDSYSAFVKDGISYIIAPVSGYTEERSCIKCSQYYIIDFDGINFSVKEGRID